MLRLFLLPLPNGLVHFLVFIVPGDILLNKLFKKVFGVPFLSLDLDLDLSDILYFTQNKLCS